MDQLVDSRQVDAFEITPAMVEAGISELYEQFRLGGDWGDLVTSIYIAMFLTTPQQLQRVNEAI